MYEDLVDFGDFIKSLVEKKETPEELIMSLIPAYENKIDEVTKLMAEFEQKKELGLWWDSKVPEEDKVGWSQFWEIPVKNINWSGVSDKGEVISEVKNFFKFYEEIEGLAQEINEVATEKGIGAAESQINCLSKKLKASIRNAEEEKDMANSSAVYHLHRRLISMQSRMISKLESVHLKAAREKNRELEGKLTESVNLSEEYRRLYDGSERRNQELAERLGTVEEQVAKIATLMKNVTIEGGMSLCK